MSRKPVDQLATSSKPQGQDGVWACLRMLRTATVGEIVRETDINRKTVADYLHRLLAGGYVTVEGTPARYTLIRDAGHHAPRLRADGSAVTQGAGTRNMWRSMNMMGEFSALDLAVHSTAGDVTVTEATAKSYCTALLKAGYLRVVQKARPGVRPAIYRLVRKTGPRAPQIQRVKQVWDPNLGAVMSPKTEARS
ncbi:Phage protein [Rhodovulum sp. P5]|uniref:transcriptional regulator n=1 Tax=Rhodovulum phage vB_RhkS_P1 TaxID=1873452 RepID=UPI00080AA052|nr:hypothetical protein [Rhodovulum sp. P5]YP_009285897.1 transcriptional regulator [Rhodovulum phage vB_RhkS_P1]ANT39883.1 hypothetical protein Rhks_12 [Rhodovulum phage vB_RhkS_P1]ARE38953.1 Phage protein [Rhodovulum sp. P5]